MTDAPFGSCDVTSISRTWFFPEILTLSRFIKVNCNPGTIFVHTVRFASLLWIQNGVDCFCTFNGFRENWNYMMKGQKLRLPPIWDPLLVWWPPPRNFKNSFLTFQSTHFMMIFAKKFHRTRFWVFYIRKCMLAVNVDLTSIKYSRFNSHIYWQPKT